MIQEKCVNVIKGFKGELEVEQNEGPASEADEKDKVEIELNSGVEFPGQSLEPLMDSALRLNQLTLNST